MKRILSITIISLLFSLTLIPYLNGSYSVYAAVSDEDKEQAAICAYFNYRGGYFTSSVGGKGAALTIVKNYINEFYNSSANTTNIKSINDFVSHITIKEVNGHWSISLDNDGVVFLDHLCKWLLGKDEFTQLYSGGAWGVASATDDNLYNGYIYGDNLFTHVYGNFSYNSNVIQGEATSCNPGSAWNGITHNTLVNYYNSQNGIVVNYNEYPTTTGSSQSYSLTYPTESSTTTGNFTLAIDKTSSVSLYRPVLYLYLKGDYPCGYIFGENTYKVRGYPTIMTIHPTNESAFNAFGVLTYNVSLQRYYIYVWRKYSRLPDGSRNTNINFKTNDFLKTDVGQEDQQNAPGVDFTPKEKNTTTNTYNYYNTDNYTEQTFINNYTNKYVEQKTIIDGSPNDDSGNGGGGSGDLPTPTNGSGSITPDGNGGYTFNLPDVGIPNFDGFNWSINGLSQKFPFSIPFDLLAFFTVLNAEPETPEIQATIPLGLWEWEIDWDLHSFDNLAALLRNLEFIGFCIALILITRRLIKG